MNIFCRTCLEIILPGEQYYNLNGVLSPKSQQIVLELESLVPQITLNVIHDPKICLYCVDAIKTAYKFKQKCIETEEKIYDCLLESNDANNAINISCVALRNQEYLSDVKNEIVYEAETLQEEFSPSLNLSNYDIDSEVAVKTEPIEFIESEYISDNNGIDFNQFATANVKIEANYENNFDIPNGFDNLLPACIDSEIGTIRTASLAVIKDETDTNSSSCEFKMPRRNKKKDRFLYGLGLIRSDDVKAYKGYKKQYKTANRLKSIMYELKTKKQRGRPRKISILNTYSEINNVSNIKLNHCKSSIPAKNYSYAFKIKRKRGRPRKIFPNMEQDHHNRNIEGGNGSQEVKIKKGRGRPRKIFTNIKQEQHQSNFEESHGFYKFKLKKRGRPRKIFTNMNPDHHKSNIEEGHGLYQFKLKKRGRPRKIFTNIKPELIHQSNIEDPHGLLKFELKKRGRPRKTSEFTNKMIDNLEAPQDKSELNCSLNARRNSCPSYYNFLSTDESKKLNYSLPIPEADDVKKCNVDYVDRDYVTNPACKLGHHLGNNLINKRFKCKYCSYRTNIKTHLLTHNFIHTGEKPYRCEYCKFKSAWKGSLRLHVKTRHP